VHRPDAQSETDRRAGEKRPLPFALGSGDPKREVQPDIRALDRQRDGARDQPWRIRHGRRARLLSRPLPRFLRNDPILRWRRYGRPDLGRGALSRVDELA
jgi:hypothetical protein